MNLSHLSAIVRMRWQITNHLFRKSGITNRILSLLLLGIAALGSLGMFVFTAGWGGFLLAKIAPFHVILVWDGLAAVFLFAWAIGLMTELQRSEVLSLKNLLHLPVSLSAAFLLNYASSIVSLTILLFLPAMLGLCCASVLHYGIRSLVVFPLLASFLLMVTAVTYQLRGWLGRLMENKRTRGTVIAVTTIAFILIFQLPNAINWRTMESRMAAPRDRLAAHEQRLAELEEKKNRGELEQQAYTDAFEAARDEFSAQEKAFRDAATADFHRTVRRVNAALPIGWLPYGASAAAGGDRAWPWLCVLGMSTIGFLSLATSLRSTRRTYVGDHNKEFRSVARKKARVFSANSILEKRLPFLSESQSVMTMATLRCTLRAPEAKMALLTPLIFACVFGSMLLTGRTNEMPMFTRSWYSVGALGVSLVGMAQMMLNMFGLDRHGFRAYVLMPAPRRDILLGKNLGIFPIAGSISVLLVVFMGVVARLPVSHVVATLFQIVVAFFIYFTVTNFTSILAPMGMVVGTMKPVSMKFSVVLAQFLALFLSPIAIIPAALALGAEQLVSFVGGMDSIPIYLLLTLLELPLAIWFYSFLLNIQARHLQQRQHRILEVVSKVAH